MTDRDYRGCTHHVWVVELILFIPGHIRYNTATIRIHWVEISYRLIQVDRGLWGYTVPVQCYCFGAVYITYNLIELNCTVWSELWKWQSYCSQVVVAAEFVLNNSTCSTLGSMFLNGGNIKMANYLKLPAWEASDSRVLKNVRKFMRSITEEMLL